MEVVTVGAEVIDVEGIDLNVATFNFVQYVPVGKKHGFLLRE